MIPDYQSLMLPVLQYVSNGQEYRMLDVIDGLAKFLNFPMKNLLHSFQVVKLHYLAIGSIGRKLI